MVGVVLEGAGAHLLVVSGGMNGEAPRAIFGRPMPAEAVSSIQNTVVRLATKMMRLVEPKISFHVLYFREHSKIVRAAVKMPLAYLGGAKSVAGVEAVMADGFDAVVKLGRASCRERVCQYV